MTRIIFAVVLLISVFLCPFLVTNDFIGSFGDLQLHYYPMKHLITERLISGDVPLWNPYIFSGMPLLANPQSGIFYPFAALFYFFPIQFAFKLWIYGHLFILLFSSFLLFEHLLKNRFSALAASVALVFSSYITYLIPAGHIIMLAGWSWIPAIIFTFIKIHETYSPFLKGVAPIKSETGYFGGGVCFLKIFLFSTLLSFQFLSGHPQGTFVTLVIIAIMFIIGLNFFIWKELIYSLALFGLIVSVQLLPSLEFSQQTENIFWKPLAKAYSLELKNLLSIILPNFYGTPLTTLQPDIPISHFFEKNKLYFGVSSLFLSFYGLFLFFKAQKSVKYYHPVKYGVNSDTKVRRHERETPKQIQGNTACHFFRDFTFSWSQGFLKDTGSIFFIFILLGFLLSFGFNTPVYEILYDNVPLWNFFRTPSRFYIIALIGFCYFVGLALNSLPRRFQVVAVAIIFLELLLWNQRFIFTQKIPVGKSEFSQVYDSNTRIFTTPEIPANLSMFYHHYNVNGYDALILRNYFRTFYSYFQPPDVSPPSTFFDVKDYNSLVKNDFPGWAMRYVITTAHLDGKPLKTGSVKIYEKPEYSSKIFIPQFIEKSKSPSDFKKTEPLKCISVNTESSGKNSLNAVLKRYFQEPEKIKLEVDVKNSGWLVIGDVYYPGWQAWSDGKKLQMSSGDGVFRALFLNKDVKSVYLIFAPGTYKLGVFMTVLTTIFIVGYIFIKCFRVKNFDKYCLNDIIRPLKNP